MTEEGRGTSGENSTRPLPCFESVVVQRPHLVTAASYTVLSKGEYQYYNPMAFGEYVTLSEELSVSWSTPVCFRLSCLDLCPISSIIILLKSNFEAGRGGRHSNGSGSQTLSPSPGPGSSPTFWQLAVLLRWRGVVAALVIVFALCPLGGSAAPVVSCWRANKNSPWMPSGLLLPSEGGSKSHYTKPGDVEPRLHLCESRRFVSVVFLSSDTALPHASTLACGVFTRTEKQEHA
ncbi:hypothetical protein INR49_007639 [Caranx melampygus]|nr:hypothetical protein INR49_007639 [Caranx melampygus]